MRTSAIFIAWGEKLRSDKRPRAGLLDALEAVLRNLGRSPSPLMGDPRRDWNSIKRLLTTSRQPNLLEVADGVDYLIAFDRADRITSKLSAMWMESGSYTHARSALDQALTAEIILSALDSEKGIHVLNMHKCKGREFDGVIVFRDGHNSSLVWRDDPHPHPKSRKLLFVAVTHSRKHVLLAGIAVPNHGPFQIVGREGTHRFHTESSDADANWAAIETATPMLWVESLSKNASDNRWVPDSLRGDGPLSGLGYSTTKIALIGY